MSFSDQSAIRWDRLIGFSVGFFSYPFLLLLALVYFTDFGCSFDDDCASISASLWPGIIFAAITAAFPAAIIAYAISFILRQFKRREA